MKGIQDSQNTAPGRGCSSYQHASVWFKDDQGLQHDSTVPCLIRRRIGRLIKLDALAADLITASMPYVTSGVCAGRLTY